MKVLKISLVLLTILCLLSSCFSSDVNPTANPAQSPNIDIEGIYTDRLTVFIFKSPIYDNDEAMAAYASEIIAEAGWKIDFKIVDRPNLYGNFKPEDYQKMILSELDSGKDVVFEYNGFLDMDEFKYNHYLARTDKGGYDYIKTMGQYKEYKYQGIYIRTDLEELYGNVINSIKDYNNFLEWVKRNNPEDTACLMVMQSPFIDALNPISLFAQMSGYTKVDHAIYSLHDEGSTIFMSDVDMYNYKNSTPEVYEAAELPFFLEMDTYLNKWHANGLIHFTDYDDLKTTTGYSSIICNVKDTTNYYSRDHTTSRYQVLDVSDFNLHILTDDNTSPLSPHIYERRWSSTFAFASEKPSASLAGEFLDWIYSSTDNYNLFMFGIESVDYNVIDGKLEFLTNPNGLRYGEWSKHASFIDDTMHPTMPHFPSNWQEVQHDLSQTKGFYISGSSTFTTKDGTKYISNEKLIEMNTLNSINSGVYSLYEKYFKDIGKGKSRYTQWDLGVDLEKSKAVEERLENYRKMLVFVAENN